MSNNIELIYAICGVLYVYYLNYEFEEDYIMIK